jgi:aldose 1-epimerase
LVQGTPLDFRKSKPLGQDISKVENGYDHCFVIDREDKAADELAFVARASDPVSGRVLEVYSTGEAREGICGAGCLCA